MGQPCRFRHLLGTVRFALVSDRTVDIPKMSSCHRPPFAVPGRIELCNEKDASAALFNTQPRAPAHFPEVGLKPRRLLKDRDQLGFARGRDIEIGEPVQVRPRLRRDLLVWRTGIFVDPDAIGVRLAVRLRPRGEPSRRSLRSRPRRAQAPR